jgi:hypothetical protein
MRITSNPQFICPLHVGECSGGSLLKFTDFSPSLYSDSVTAMAVEAPVVNQTKAVNQGKKKNKRRNKPKYGGKLILTTDNFA